MFIIEYLCFSFTSFSFISELTITRGLFWSKQTRKNPHEHFSIIKSPKLLRTGVVFREG